MNIPTLYGWGGWRGTAAGWAAPPVTPPGPVVHRGRGVHFVQLHPRKGYEINMTIMIDACAKNQNNCSRRIIGSFLLMLVGWWLTLCLWLTLCHCSLYISSRCAHHEGVCLPRPCGSVTVGHIWGPLPLPLDSPLSENTQKQAERSPTRGNIRCGQGSGSLCLYIYLGNSIPQKVLFVQP